MKTSLLPQVSYSCRDRGSPFSLSFHMHCVLLVGVAMAVMSEASRLGRKKVSLKGQRKEKRQSGHANQHFSKLLKHFLSPFDLLFPQTYSWDELEEHLLVFTVPHIHRSECESFQQYHELIP